MFMSSKLQNEHFHSYLAYLIMMFILQVRANTIRSIVLVDNQLDEKGNPADLKTPPRTITWAESPKKRILYSRLVGRKHQLWKKTIFSPEMIVSHVVDPQRRARLKSETPAFREVPFQREGNNPKLVSHSELSTLREKIWNSVRSCFNLHD